MLTFVSTGATRGYRAVTDLWVAMWLLRQDDSVAHLTAGES